MKKRTLFLLFLIISLLGYGVGLAEENLGNETDYKVIAPSVTLVEESGVVRNNALTASLYVSDDEIWFSGTSDDGKPWLICANRQGEVLFSGKLSDAPGNRMQIYCFSKVESTLLLGIIDFETQLGTVGVMQDERAGDISYHRIGDAKISEMVSARDGLLALGVVYDDTEHTCALSLTKADRNGAVVFQTVGDTYDVEMEGGSLPTSICCAAGDKYFVQENLSVESRVRPDRKLTCVDGNGAILWSVPLRETIAVLKMTADENNLYLLGITGTTSPETVLDNQKAMVQCYSHDGRERWIRVFDTLPRFIHGGAGNGVCVAATMENGYWWLCVLHADGSVRAMQTREAETQYINSIAFNAAGNMIVLGMSHERLLIMDIPY